MSGLIVEIAGLAGDFAVSAAFEAERGITVLFGPSGSGKTSLLRMIAGALRPQTGRIALGERVLFDAALGVDLAPQRRRIGFVYQDGRLFPHLSVRRNLTYARWAGRRTASRSFDEVVDLLGLGQLLDRAPETLSGGERQRVAIGRALLADPALLLMDEPLSSLDQTRRQEVLPYLEAIRAETRVPIVYVSHDLDEVARLGDTLVVMREGRMVAAGPASDLFGRPDLGPPLGGVDAGVLIEGVVVAWEPDFGLAVVDIGGARLELAAEGLPPGERLRMRVRARDVAIAREAPRLTSVRNVIPCVIEEVAEGPGAHAEVTLRVGAQRLRSQITRKSTRELKLTAGLEAFAALKAVSIDRRPFAGQAQPPILTLR